MEFLDFIAFAEKKCLKQDNAFAPMLGLGNVF